MDRGFVVQFGEYDRGDGRLLHQGRPDTIDPVRRGLCARQQVYTLEKVLVVKKDPVTQVVFLDEAMKVCL